MSEIKTDTPAGKVVAVVFSGRISRHAFEAVFDGKCAFERAVICAGSLPSVESVVVLLPGAESPLPGEIETLAGSSTSKPVKFFSPGDFNPGTSVWTEALLCKALEKISSCYESLYFMWADTPFIDIDFSSQLYQRHIRYGAEYTFADCYPVGLAPEIFASGILSVLSKMAEGNNFPAGRDSLFNVIKKDINSFDIETDVASEDVRMMRIILACNNLRNLEICQALSGINASNYGEIIRDRQASLRSRPAFYAFQISGRCPFECPHCPYPAFCSSGTGKSPGIPAIARKDYMKKEDFETALEKISGYSEDAVVSLSLWGECSFHPEVPQFVESVLRYPGLSLLIETTGTDWNPDTLKEISRIAAAADSKSSFRPYGKVNWIVSIDAVSPGMYSRIHGLDEREGEAAFRKSLEFVKLASELFPGCVYPQFLRMKENEEELENFFRYWKDSLGNVIIQKYDTFCSSLPDRRPADLSPIIRYPCWHLKRDFSVLLDGTVPLCREDIYGTMICGNIFTDSIAEIIEKNAPLYSSQINCEYKGLCGACDEYYTFNF